LYVHALPQISNAITPDVRVTLEAVKALSVIHSVDLDPGRVESILKIALSNALNVSWGRVGQHCMA
jgi:hypothetical protein